ncbi:MAG: DUF4377 domain-containing protein [Cyclobacteriaceae bacterium]
MLKIIPLFILLILMSCGNVNTGETETILWINSERVPCVGVAPRECLQVKRSEDGDWENFYARIEGFNFEPGFLYKIRVKETELPANQVPADASSIRYELVEELEKIRAGD